MSNFTYNDKELYHFGTIGMKWGLRKYQYEDGTLTPEGIERYRKGKKEIDKLEERAKRHEAKYAKADYKRAVTRNVNRAVRQDKKAARERYLASKDLQKADKIRKRIEKDMDMSIDEVEKKYGKNAVPSMEYAIKLVDQFANADVDFRASKKTEIDEAGDIERFAFEKYLDLFPRTDIKIEELFKIKYDSGFDSVEGALDYYGEGNKKAG